MKISTQTTVVIVAGIIGLLGLVIGLAVFAKWSEGAIIAMVTAFGAMFVNAFMTVRNQAKTAQTLDAQDVKLDTVVRQTNGMSEAERQDIAERAALSVVAQFRGTSTNRVQLPE